MKVLLTGAAGLIGSQMTEVLLQQGASVLGFDNLSLGSLKHVAPFSGHKGYDFVKADISKPEWYAGLKGRSFDVLIHLAANSDISLGHANPKMELERTTLTTFESLLAAKELKIPHFIFSSTSAVYGANPVFPTPEETTRLYPVSNYGAAKLASENFISSFVENYGLSAWVFRFGNVVGEKLTHGVIFDFIKKLKANDSELEVLGNGLQNKTYIDVTDCVAGILWAHQKAPAGTKHADRFQVFNLSTEGSTSVKDIAEKTVHHITRGKAKIRYGTSSVGWVGDVPKTSLLTTKIQSLGWQPKFSSNDAVFNSIESYHAWAYGA